MWVIIQSSRQDRIKRQGVALVVQKAIAENITEYSCISERLMSVSFDTTEGILTIIQVYAPDSSYPEADIDEFYDSLQQHINSLPSKNKYILLGDFNAKVGEDQHENWSTVVGQYGLGTANGRGLQLLQFCAINDLLIVNTIYRHSNKIRVTWISPDGNNRNQIDFIIIQSSWKSKVKNSSAYHSASIGSDHFMVIANIKLQCQTTQETIAKKI